jgi:hypothetical protein
VGCVEYMVDQFDPDFWLYANEWSPDSKHKNTQEALWLEARQNPTFIHSYLVTSRSRGAGPWLVEFYCPQSGYQEHKYDIEVSTSDEGLFTRSSGLFLNYPIEGKACSHAP